MKSVYRWLLLSMGALMLIAGAVYGFLVLAIVPVFSPFPGYYNCYEFDGDFPTTLGLNYAKAGFISGQFNYPGAPTFPNGTLVTQKFFDDCTSSTTLIEFVCGKSIAPAYAPYAGAVMVTCGEPGVNGTTCVETVSPYGINQTWGKCV